MRDALFLAVRVEKLTACDAEPLLDAAGRIVDAGVDHLGVARRGLLADRGILLEHDHLAAAERELTPDREPDHARADHDGVDGVARHALLRRRDCSRSARAAPFMLRWRPRAGGKRS